MVIPQDQIRLLKRLMASSARKDNLANAGLLVEKGEVLATAESLVNTKKDPTAHSELVLVRKAARLKQGAFNLGLTIITVIEPCLMCISACSWAGFKEIKYIIPANKYIKKMPWMSEAPNLKKEIILSALTNPIKYIHLKEYEEEFCEIFEKEMKKFLI